MPPKIRKSATICGICGNTEYALGFCHAHYMQNYAIRNKEDIAESRRQYRIENHERILAAKLEYRIKNAQGLSDKQKVYSKEHPEETRRRALASGRKRRARIAGVESEYVSDDALIAYWGGDCYLCGEEINLLAPRRAPTPGWEESLWRDHVTPIVAGGSDTLDNLRPTHAVCNLRKGSKIIDI
jgi:5-methylcytosine-specific restriction endonuclease McrA